MKKVQSTIVRLQKFEGGKKRKYKRDFGGFSSLREVSPMIHRQTR